MNVSYTPGPWHTDRKMIGVDVIADSGRAVAATYGVCNHPKTVQGISRQREEDRANAALISAAPEMLSAIKFALEIAESKITGTWDDLLHFRDVIKKAEGSK